MPKSDKNCRDIYYCKVVNNPELNKSKYWLPWKWQWQNGGHQLLPTTYSPTISACTTSTNLSSLDFQSNSTIYKYPYGSRGMIMDNLRNAQPEIEPLNYKSELNINADDKELELESSKALCENDTKAVQWRKMAPQLIAAIAVSWVSMVIGYVSAFTSPTESSLKHDFGIDKKQIAWISGFMPLFAILGGLLGGPSIEYLGRKWTLLLTDILFLLSWMLSYFAQNYWFLYVSRMIAGCGVGIASLTLPVYLGETVQPEVRGSLGLLPTAFGNIGILLCFLLGIVFEWKGISGIGVLLPLPFFILIWFLPETPLWYLSKGRHDDAHKALVWLRDKGNPDVVEKEFEELRKNQKASDEKSNNSLSDLFSRTNVKSFMIVLGLMFFQQMSGINAIIFYTTDIFRDAGSTLEPTICTTIVGVVNFISTFVATVLIDRLGRKVLLYISSTSIIITTGILGGYFYLLNNVHEVDVRPYGWLPLASFVIYVLGFSLGFGPIPWLMMGEILPAKIRGPAASVATGFNWSCTFLVTTTFPLLKETIGPEFIFWLFGCITILGLAFTISFVPETRGQSLDDIERKLAGVKVRRMSSVANLKPLQSTF